MKKIKKNNKGFSLVELIVVILIMAIIAVALAPQVMKWVDKSKKATDAQNYDALVANCQLALIKDAAYTESKVASSSAILITIKQDKTYISTDNAIAGALDELDADWRSVKIKDKDHSGDYVIRIYDGAVHKGSDAERPEEVNND